MSNLSRAETLLSRPSWAPLVTPLEPYQRVIWEVVDEPDFGLTSRTRRLDLPAVALATLEVHAAPRRRGGRKRAAS